jgi:competence ComEA-like helix-hairpin-helix protein
MNFKQQFKNIWQEYFSFSTGERRGVYVLSLILIVIILVNQFVYLLRPEQKMDFTTFENQINSFEASLKVKNINVFEDRLNKAIKAKYDSLTLFNFDPNIATYPQWLNLGLTEKQIKTIENYLGKGGHFYTKEDFKKMYGIRAKQYEILRPYITLPEQTKVADNEAESSKDIIQNLNTNQSEPNSGLFNFDPNSATDEQWKKLGLNDKQIKTLNNYLSKGGHFYKKEDLKKVYGVSEELFLKLEPYITCSENTKKTQENNITEKFVVELNIADTATLKKINGIKLYYANEIVKYREKLGGFANAEQLMEIKNFREETLQKISSQIKIDKSKIRKININQATIKDFLKHPYFDFPKAKAITDFRNKNGLFKNLKQLVENKLLLQKDFDKIVEYITIE